MTSVTTMTKPNCLRCNPNEDAYNWCKDCCDLMAQETANREKVTKDWKWFSFGVGVNKPAYWRVIFAPNKRSAQSHMKQMYRHEHYTFYTSHPDPKYSCILAERVYLDEALWRIE